MLPNILQVLSQAIKERHAIAVRYADQRQIRVVEPHAVYTDERGELVLDAYQVRGYSSSGRPAPFWRPLRLKKISAVQELNETFVPRAAEGFSGARLKYRNGLVALVQQPAAAFSYPVQSSDMGPHLPEGLRR